MRKVRTVIHLLKIVMNRVRKLRDTNSQVPLFFFFHVAERASVHFCYINNLTPFSNFVKKIFCILTSRYPCHQMAHKCNLTFCKIDVKGLCFPSARKPASEIVYIKCRASQTEIKLIKEIKKKKSFSSKLLLFPA